MLHDLIFTILVLSLMALSLPIISLPIVSLLMAHHLVAYCSSLLIALIVIIYYCLSSRRLIIQQPQHWRHCHQSLSTIAYHLMALSFNNLIVNLIVIVIVIIVIIIVIVIVVIIIIVIVIASWSHVFIYYIKFQGKHCYLSRSYLALFLFRLFLENVIPPGSASASASGL